ncbi:helix-turn-helix transcriptional regulator [Leeia sp. TBRC 13508]|uniref:Helix-turn-helix transcriptional regulator n=1 Tax=Leeia speluncae TaxID=2884804 RepID=A0ABS8D9D1_9NEIS|nr:helix-turn-helix transcriptional regulator [Leeia speluncae]MCB6184821.1 helix-turn-helix transcriptional regulator [Leeia speluncae]
MAEVLATELAEFIRKHRELRRPEEVGISAGKRRRTPGLRREELAQLCGVSITWITWLEQGRDIQPSAKMLDRLATALGLTDSEKRYLFRLAARPDPAELAHADPSIEKSLQDTLKAINSPAYVLDKTWRAVSWNKQASQLFQGWLDSHATTRNLLTFALLSETAHTLIPDWQIRCQRLVAEFRADCVRYRDDEEIQSLINELTAQSTLFVDAWHDQKVTERYGGLRKFCHPEFGETAYNQQTFYPASRPDLKLVILTKA